MDSNEHPKKKLKTSVCEDVTSKISEEICITSLPTKLLIRIFTHLDFKAVAQCSIVCKTFYAVSKNPEIYHNVILQEGMTTEHLEAYTTKITCPQKLTVIYKKCFRSQDMEDSTEFNNYLTPVLEKCKNCLTDISISNCRSHVILKMLFECESLTRASFIFCKGFNTALRSTNLKHLHFETCDVPSDVMLQILKDNINLKSITLVNNINLHTNGIAKSLGSYNTEIEDIHFVEKRRVRAKGIESIARCKKLKNLVLNGSPFQCDPEYSLEHLAAGCPVLERLSIHGWKGLTDDKLLPILQSCTQLKYLDLRGVDVTIKSCKEAALSLPLLKHMDFDKCERIKRNQLLNLKKDFPDIKIVVY